MNTKNKLLKIKLMQEVRKKLSERPELNELSDVLISLLEESFDNTVKTDNASITDSGNLMDESRLSLVLQSYRGLKDSSGNEKIKKAALTLAQIIAPLLPGNNRNLWMAVPTENKGVTFESNVAKIDISIVDNKLL